MSVWLKLGVLVLLALLPLGPVQGQDVFRTFLTIMNENARAGSSPRNPIAVQPQQANTELLQIQRSLANLGYDVGIPDGISGPRTRRAISAYQQSIGVAPTGSLTPSQRDTLLSGASPIHVPAPVITVPTARPDFDLLHDVDLPGNDFRSGMSEPSLKGLALDGCLEACSADGLCQAFTYNAKAKVCFLKSGGASPAPFSGAISGMRKGDSGGAATLAVLNGQRALLPSEVARLQDGLAKRGYDVGTPDGVIGGKTRAAIARFVAENPGQASQQINLALLRAVTGQGARAPSAIAEVDTSAYRTLEEIDRNLALIAIARDNSILDDHNTLLTWFTRNAHGDKAALYNSYEKANSVDKEVILARYRQTLIDEAKAYVADAANMQFRIRITTMAQIGQFQPGIGLMLTSGFSTVLSDKRLLHRIFPSNRVFGGLTLDAPDIRAVPVADEAAASALIDAIRTRSGNSQSNVTVWLTISEIGIDRNAGSTPLDADIPITVSVDKVSLMTYGSDGKVLGDELAVLYVPTQSIAPSGTTTDNILIAENFGLPVIEGYLVVPGGVYGDHSWLASVLGVGSDYAPRLGRFINLAALRLNPDRTDGWIEEPEVRALMDQGQHLRVYGRSYYEFGRFENPFDRRRALTVYAGEVVPELIANAPSLPLNVVSITPAKLGEYDFASQSFPVTYPDSQVIYLDNNIGRLRATAQYRDLPSMLSVDEVSAESMVRSAQNGQPQVYVATFGTLSLPPQVVATGELAEGEEDPNFGALTFTPARSGIFADVTLTQPLLSLELAQYVTDPKAPRAPRAPTEAQLALDKVVVTTELELLAHAFDRLNPQGLGESIVNSATTVRNASEFDVAEQRKEVERALVAAPRRPVWLKGRMNFGTYNAEKGAFDGAEVRFELPYEGGFSANYQLSLIDPRQLANISIPADRAEQIAGRPDRETQVMAQVDLVDITSDGSAQTPTYKIVLDLKEVLVLLPPGDGMAPELIARITPPTGASTPGAQIAQAPPLTKLDPEALDYLRIKYAPDSMDDAEYERMMSARWAMEQANWMPASEHFFPPGADLLSAAVRQRWLPDFKAWAQSRVDGLSDPLRLACANPISGHWTSPLRDLMLKLMPELESATPIDRIAPRYATPHLTGPIYFEIPGYLMEAQPCASNSGVAPTPLIEALGLKAKVASGAVIKVADAVLPGTNGLANRAVDLALVIDSVEMHPHPQGGKLALLINTHFDSAWYSGNPPTQAASASDMEALKAKASNDTAIPDGWDIVGLRPGLTLEEADAVIRKHMNVAAVYTRQQGQRTTPYFHNERSYVSDTLSEAITLIYEPGKEGEKVHLIARALGAPIDTMPTEDILVALRAKYGQERLSSIPQPGQFIIRWHSQETPRSTDGVRDLQHCGRPSVMMQGYWTATEGGVEQVDASVVPHIQVHGYMVLPGVSDTSADLLEYGALDCGISVQAQKSRSGNDDQLLILMVDYAGYAKGYAEAKDIATQSVATGDASPEAAPTLDFKF